MQIVVKARRLELSDRMREYAESKLDKLSRHLDEEATTLEIELREEQNPKVENPFVAEATLHTHGTTMRAEEGAGDVYAAIDMVADKLHRQAKRWREKQVQRQQKGAVRGGGPMPHGVVLEKLEHADDNSNRDEDMDMAATDRSRIHRTTQYLKGPMSAEDAALQLELVGHDFFVFVDEETSQTCVLYRRSEGGYGLVEAQIAEEGIRAS